MVDRDRRRFCSFIVWLMDLFAGGAGNINDDVGNIAKGVGKLADALGKRNSGNRQRNTLRFWD